MGSSGLRETGLVENCPRDSYGRCLEKIARATGGAYDRHHAATVVAEGVYDMLDCEQVFLLAPSRNPQAVCVTAAAPVSEARLRVGETWDLGEQASQVFDRPSDYTDARAEPYSILNRHLSDADLSNWRALPLRPAGMTRPVGLLGIADCSGVPFNGPPPVPESMLSSVAAALWRIQPDAGHMTAAGPPTRDGHDVERMRALTNMASGVAHSLANIFSAILGNLHFLGEEVQDGSGGDLLRKLGESTYAGIDMMRSLEKFAARPASVDMQPMDVRDVVRDVADLVRRMCIDSRACRGIRLHADLGEPCPAWGSPGQIREALINIVFNAIQALGDGGEIALVVRGEAGHACIAVRDNGPGMTKEVTRRAAEPFFTTCPGVHQGLGLSVARGIIVAHRGQLTIQSEPGRGTCVNLRLPCKAPRDPRSATQVQAPEQVISEVLSSL